MDGYRLLYLHKMLMFAIKMVFKEDDFCVKMLFKQRAKEFKDNMRRSMINEFRGPK